MRDPGVSVADIRAAADRLRPHLTRTPLLRSWSLDQRCQGEIFLKAENLNPGGSVKLRGVLNRLLDEKAGAKGLTRPVVSYGPTNFCLSLAMAANQLGTMAHLVMPEGTSPRDLDAVRRHGGEVHPFDPQNEHKEEWAAEWAEHHGALVLAPYDDPLMMAGYGTAGLEIADEMGRLGHHFDQVLVCCASGGLAAGIGLAIHADHPGASLITVEPRGFDDMKRSLIAGSRVNNAPGGTSLCEALLAPSPSAMAFPILRHLRARGVAVSDRETLAAMRFALEELRVVLEPSGAVALAAVLYGYVQTRGKRTVVLLSGGNSPPNALGEAMTLSG